MFICKDHVFGWLGLLALSACSGGGREFKRAETAAAQYREARRVLPTAPQLINLPAVLRLRMADFSARFGQPLPLADGFADPTKEPLPGTAATESMVRFESKGIGMIVSFDVRTGAVRDVLLLGSDEATLMRQATLLPDAPDYVLLPVFTTRHTDHLLGLRVVPK
jgi:hypothetical protein